MNIPFGKDHTLMTSEEEKLWRKIGSKRVWLYVVGLMALAILITIAIGLLLEIYRR